MFEKNIYDWKSWGEVFTDKSAFYTVAEKCFSQSAIDFSSDFENLTPGTNAVFKSGKYVIKIAPPKECGIDFSYYMDAEERILAFCRKANINSPSVLAKGTVEDKYLFRYIIMDFINGKDISFFMEDVDDAFMVEKLKEIQKKLNIPFKGLKTIDDFPHYFLSREKCAGLNENLLSEFEEEAQKRAAESYVLVHGDMTGDNILYDGRKMYLIDFADCILAPKEYELPAIVFDLFLCEKNIVRLYIGNESCDDFVNRLIFGLSLHEYKGELMKMFFDKINISYGEVCSLREFKDILLNVFQ